MKYRAVIAIPLGLWTIAATSQVQWAFPGLGNMEVGKPTLSGLQVAGSTRRYSAGIVYGRTRAPDWFPASHPPAPIAVLEGSTRVTACGYCHLPDGSGRVENADLRGLPVSYIEEQVHAFASGARRSADPNYAPAQLMAAIARAVRPVDLHAAARYFSGLEPVSHSRVVEVAWAPHASAWHFVYRFDPGMRERIGTRILEGPDDPAAYELRDPRAMATAWVPPGSLARGRSLAATGAPGVPACESCHTANLVGIGGASPTFIARQLAGFRSRARNDPDAAPMQAVAGHLTDAQIVDVAAYVGAHQPWTRAQLKRAEAH